MKHLFERSLSAPFIIVQALLAIGIGSAQAQDWPNFGNDLGGSQFTPLDQITAENVSELKVAWVHRSGDVKKNPGGTSHQSVPIVTNGMLYYCTPLNRIFALDPETGKEIWVFDPFAPDAETGKPLIEGGPAPTTCRGVAFWEDTQAEAGAVCKKRIFRGDRYGNLWAVDADTGRLCRDFGAETGRIGHINNGDYEAYGDGFSAMPSPPAIVGDVVVGAIASNDGTQDANDGIVRGFDARTGAVKWEFNPIPKDRSDQTGAANVWSTMSVDSERNLVFLPTTSPSTDYYGGERRFPIPLADAIVAVDGASGDVAWHYQTIRHDLYDYDLVGHPLLVTIMKDGAPREVAILQTKMGWLFVFDRETGEPLWPIEEMPVPATNIPEDEAAPTQPRPIKPDPFAGQMIKREDLFGLAYFDKKWCQSEFDKLRYEGMYTPPDLREALLFPSALGGGNWGGAAFDPASNLLIIKAENLATRLRLVPKDGKSDEDIKGVDYLTRSLVGTPYAVEGEIFMSPLGIPCTPTPWGTISAIDMSSGDLVWQRPIGQITRFGVTTPEALEWGSPNIGGPMVTGSGLIFMAGTMDRKIRALEVKTGKELWHGKLPFDGASVPVSYMASDRQFIAISAGGVSRVTDHLGDALVAFALPE